MNVAARILSFFLTMAALASAAAATEFPEGKQKWLVLERQGTKLPEIVAVLENLPVPDVRAKFPVLLQILWGYASLANGMPTEEEIVRGRDLYANLDRIIGMSGIYAMSRTGDGGRTIYYYVASPESHAEALRQYFDSVLPISVKVITRNDPEWSSIREVLNEVN
ncbi:MAG: DUF695 domain-containing protein [Hylemonella sp.]|nr:DUF695 domain-containing protein [Hylemonella sp.]MDP1938955.1 DUF695 domain-containing protein [Hylemonella sp.]